MKRAVLGWAFILSGSVASSAAAVEQPSCTGEHWAERASEYEELLLNSQIIAIEDVGSGVTKPKKVVLKVADGGILKAVFKPISRGRQRGYWESYEAEVVAYELDKLMGLQMVPPTVERRIGKVMGSLQLWVDDCNLYKDVEGRIPATPHWSNELSRMKIFDNLICNRDRNAGNFLVGNDGTIVLIDHSRAFLTDKKLEKDEVKLPAQFPRGLVEKLKELDKEDLRERFDGLLMKGQIDAIVERRDLLLEYLGELIASRGEAEVLF